MSWCRNFTKCTILQVVGYKLHVQSVLSLPLIETKWRSYSLKCQDLLLCKLAMSCVETVNGLKERLGHTRGCVDWIIFSKTQRYMAARHNTLCAGRYVEMSCLECTVPHDNLTTECNVPNEKTWPGHRTRCQTKVCVPTLTFPVILTLSLSNSCLIFCLVVIHLSFNCKHSSTCMIRVFVAVVITSTWFGKGKRSTRFMVLECCG